MNIYINGEQKIYDLDYNSYGGTYDITIPLDPFLEASITADKTTVNKGDKVTITANAIGGSGTYTYKYAILNVDTGKWSVLKDFNSSNTFTYTLNYPGKKQFAVTVKDSNGKTIGTNRIDVNVKNATTPLTATLKSNGSTSAVTINKGGNIKLDVAAIGGSGTYTYKFAVLNVDNGKWSVLKDFSNTSSFTYKLDYPGKKQFAVTVKDNKGATVATNRIDVTVTNTTAPSVTLKANGSTETITAKVNDSINLVATAVDGTAPYTYKFAVYNVDTNSWYILKDFSASATHTVKLSSIGKKEFVVTAKDSKGNTVSPKRIKVTATS